MAPTQQQLLDFLNTLDPIPQALIKQLNKNPQATITKWMVVSKDDWEKIAGVPNGIYIYNHLHPSPQSSRSGSEMDLSVTISRQKRQKTGWTTTSIVALKYDPSSALFELDSAYLADSGLPASQKLVLYCRPTFHQQFNFLQESVLENARLGWIMGPPGTGKSTTALAFASTLDSNQWIVTWIHLSRMDFPVCVRYERGGKKTRSIWDRSLDELDDVLDEVEGHRRHIIFIDGYALNGDKHIDIQKTCYSWLKKDKVNRRLVVVCSMSSRGKTKLEEDMMNNVEEFFVYSWGLDEYLAAIQHEAFFNNIKHNLDSSDDLPLSSAPTDTEPSRIDLIKAKFYFAGGCSRFMFLFKTATVIEYLDESVAAVSDIMQYITGAIGDISNAVINRLFSNYHKPGGISRKARHTCIVSEWTASQLAMKGGPGLVKNLAVVTHHQHNPAMNGWLFEMWFFALLHHCGVTLCDDLGNKQEEWASSIVQTFTDFPKLSDDYGVWLKPIKWNQGGFDAIFIDKPGGLVRFVQVTRGDSHSFKIGYFYKFLRMLRDSPWSFEIGTLEIVFLVLKGKIANFKISEVSGQGLLADFGWKKGKEKDNIQVVGITGWD
jgi:DNA polymerase III delta prime subunit